MSIFPIDMSSPRKRKPKIVLTGMASAFTGVTVWFLAVLLGGQCAAAELTLPAVGAPGFTDLCRDMYAARDAGVSWPNGLGGDAHHCTLQTKKAEPAKMSIDDYAWALRKSLTFACKSKREVIYEVVRRLKDCGGETRTLIMRPDPENRTVCRVSFSETGEAFGVQPPLIADLIDWRENMPWYERLLVNLFAPRELPMVMDGLIGCVVPDPG